MFITQGILSNKGWYADYLHQFSKQLVLFLKFKNNYYALFSNNPYLDIVTKLIGNTLISIIFFSYGKRKGKSSINISKIKIVPYQKR